MICVSYIYNLFCSDKKFACKMVTIRKYHAMVPHEERLPAKTFEVVIYLRSSKNLAVYPPVGLPFCAFCHK